MCTPIVRGSQWSWNKCVRTTNKLKIENLGPGESIIYSTSVKKAIYCRSQMPNFQK